MRNGSEKTRRRRHRQRAPGEGKFPAQRVSERILLAAADAAGALPLIFAGSPEIIDIGALLDTVDGVLLTGARANVHPSHFGLDEDPRMSLTTATAMRWRCR